jgi:glycosyltransferase involved in cell wall biosynthesis
VGGTNPSLLEAMACSNLIIAHDNPFNREVLQDSGLFFTTRADLAAAINAIDSAQVDIQKLRNQATERIRASYQWSQIADSYLKLLERQPVG